MANCTAVEDPQFQPAMRLLSSVTRANPAVVTTTFDHDYLDGTIVRFHIPKYYGMRELDRLQGTITVTGDTTFTVDINTKGFQVFAAPAAKWWHSKCALVIPIGEINSQGTAAVQDVT